jgi:hypothetical protein
MTLRLAISGWWVLALLGCDGSAAMGTVQVSITGEEGAQLGWPLVEDAEVVAFDDDWEVRFRHVIVGVAGFRLRDGREEIVANQPPGYLVDLHQGDQDLWELTDVPAQRWPDVGYRIAPPGGASVRLGEIPEAIAAAMQDEGLSLWIEGMGTKADREVPFTFGIPGGVTLSRCLNGLDETDGMIVGEGRTSEVELTLHLDHLFWDDHDAEEPRLLFGPIAYAAGDDGMVSLDALASQRLADLRAEDGEPLVDEDGMPIVYIPRVELADNNLREYLIDTALTLGHFNGEGHCRYAVE